MSDELQLLTLRFEDDKASHRRREAYLASLLLHLLLIIFILVSPRIFNRTDEKHLVRSNLTGLEDSKELGLLALDKDYQKLLQKPKTPPLSEKDFPAKTKLPSFDAKKLPVQYPKKNAPVQEQPSSSDLSNFLTPPPLVTPSTATQNAVGTLPPTRSDETEGKQTSSFQSGQPSAQSSQPTSRSLREISESLESPGFSVQKAIEKARQSGDYGKGGEGGNSIHNFDHRNPDFSVEQPSIISDTQGVDFSPWLHLIYYRVRDNWFSVIPELIRTGTKGKVVVIFDVHKNGRTESLEVLRSSGLSPYDRAAVSSIKLSEPFPGFPPAFNGELITVQFTYLYNIRMR